MREIKFRVWDKEKKEMSEPFTLFDFYSDESGFKWVGLTNLDYPKEIIFMQFTGLKDKNGKDIFEGDILKTEKDVITKEEDILIVEWEVTGWAYNKVKKRNYQVAMPSHKCEIIGNKFENPELLK